MATQAEKRQRIQAEQILAWLKGWDSLRDPKAGIVDWVALKLSCQREPAKRKIVDALRAVGTERIAVDVAQSDGVRRAVALIGQATTPKDMAAIEESHWRELVHYVANNRMEAAKAAAAEVVQPKAPVSLEPGRVMDYLHKEEARLVQRIRNALTGASQDVAAVEGRVLDRDDACYLSAAPIGTLADVYRMGGELHRIREVLALLKGTDGFAS